MIWLSTRLCICTHRRNHRHIIREQIISFQGETRRILHLSLCHLLSANKTVGTRVSLSFVLNTHSIYLVVVVSAAQSESTIDQKWRSKSSKTGWHESSFFSLCCRKRKKNEGKRACAHTQIYLPFIVEALCLLVDFTWIAKSSPFFER